MKRSLLLSLLLLIACTPVSTPTGEPPSIFSDQLCGKSCWNKIVVGQTSKQELLEIIPDIPGVNQDSITIFDEPSGLFDGRVFFSLRKDVTGKQSLVNVSAYIIDQKVSALILSGSLGIEFQDVVDAFGEPELVSSRKSPVGGVNMTFISSSQGIDFGYQAESEKSGISPTTEITVLELFDTNLYQTLLTSNWLVPGQGFTLYPWEGYSKIEEHYWPPVKP